MEKITRKLISDKISEKIKFDKISFGSTKITDFILTSFHVKDETIEHGKIKSNIFCICEYIENNSIYSKAFELSI